MSKHELRFFRALYNDLHLNSVHEALFGYVYRDYQHLCSEDEVEALNIDEILKIIHDGIG